MDPEAIKKLQEENATLKQQVADKDATITKMEGDHKAEIAKKDGIIEQKNQDIIGARRKYKKLGEMTDEEKAAMTEEERKAKEEMDLIAEGQEAEAKARAEDRAKEVTSRKEQAVRKLVGTDEALFKKMMDNFDSIKGSELAYTPEEMSNFAGKAFNMLGDERPNPVRATQDGDGAAPGEVTKKGDFTETDNGKQLGSMMGLQSMQPNAENAGGNGGGN